MNEQKLRIVLFAPEEPSVMPVFFDHVVPRLRDEIAAIGVVSPIYKKSSWTGQAKKFAAAFGWREMAVEAAHYGYYRGADIVRRTVPVGRFHSVKSIARAHGVPVLNPGDVNDAEFLAELRALSPDLVISVSCPQIFKNELLELPRLGCINIHSALLPHYRGVLPTFWVLAKGEPETGVTVHYMSPGIDGGEIVLQQRVPISDTETLRSLMRKCKLTAADLTLEAVSRFREGSVSALANPAEEGSYFSFPKRADVLEFRALGRALR